MHELTFLPAINLTLIGPGLNLMVLNKPIKLVMSESITIRGRIAQVFTECRRDGLHECCATRKYTHIQCILPKLCFDFDSHHSWLTLVFTIIEMCIVCCGQVIQFLNLD